MDNLRTCKIENFEAPIGTPIYFNGKKIGRVVRNKDKKHCEIAINSDKAYSLIRGRGYRIKKNSSFSIEVVQGDKSWIQI